LKEQVTFLSGEDSWRKWLESYQGICLWKSASKIFPTAEFGRSMGVQIPAHSGVSNRYPLPTPILRIANKHAGGSDYDHAIREFDIYFQ